MIFSANILKETNCNTENVLKSEDSTRSFVTEMLEYNNSIQSICTESDVDYYKLLSEASSKKCSSLTLQEGVLNNTVKFISRIIQAFIDAIKNVFNFFKTGYNRAQIKMAQEAKKNFASRINGDLQANAKINEKKDYTVFHIPKDSEIEDKFFCTSYNNLGNLLDCTFRGETSNENDVTNALKMGFAVLSKSIPNGKDSSKIKITDAEGFKKAVLENCCYKETKNMSLFEYYKEYSYLVDDFERYKNVVLAKMSSLRSMFEKNQKDYESRSLNLSEDSRSSAKLILDAMKQLLDCVLWFVNTLISSYNSFLKYYTKILNGEIHRESSMIHGEEFDGDTLFDNNDLRDFNRTEWLDLSLTTESYMISSILMDCRKSIALKEAELLVEDNIDTFSKLTVMREEETKKASDRIMDVVKNIGKILNEFITKLQDTISIDANLIKSNQDIVYNKPFKFDTADSQGDLASGIERIKKDLSIKPFDFNTMKDDLKDDKTFFKKYILPSLSEPSKTKERSGFRYDDNMAVAEYCKAYFGAPSNDLAKCVYSAASMQKMIKDNKDFLEAPHAFIRGIKAVKSDLENQAKRIQGELSKPAPQNNNTTNSSTENNANDQKANNESAYYSELYSRWMTLSEINVEGEGPKDTAVVAANGGETSSNGTADLQSGFKVWLDTYRAVLMAKITGAEFIRKEFMAVIKKQIDAYKPKANKNTNTEEKK